MKKILALTLVALVTATGGAFAKPKPTSISLNGFCDMLTFHPSKLVTTAYTMSEDNQDCEDFYGAGFVSKVKTFGNVIIVGFRNTTFGNEAYTMEIAYPLVTGGSFQIYGTSNGLKLSSILSGTYTVNAPPVRGSRPVLSMAAKH